MKSLSEQGFAIQRLDAPLPIWRASVDRQAWADLAHRLAGSGGRLISVWGSAAGSVLAAYGMAEGLLCVELSDGRPAPDLSATFPFAGRMQRAMADLCGLQTEGSLDQRPWLNHGLWHEAPGKLPDDYPFVRVEGEGVHEIAVGPVHAGIIEPGHFRFSVVGEKLLRLEQRLGYTHKGIGRRFTEMAPLNAHRLAGRVSGDSTVAYAWAYCMALESAWGCEVPVRASWLRALMLERERVANHLGDLGALGNDAALAFGLAQFSRLREDWQRLSMTAFGHRLMMDQLLPGGVKSDLSQAMVQAMLRQCDAVEGELRKLQLIYDEHAGLQDRFMNTGLVKPELAAQLGLTGMAGRASGQARDLRCDQPWAPYDKLEFRVATNSHGDVAARVAIRFDELFESLRLIRSICRMLPAGPLQQPIEPAGAGFGIGWVEGWRGEVMVALDLCAAGRILTCHCHDPSWQNWPVLEHAVIGNIVPDFPLINKSFNLSYSGHDL